jgi:2-alkyl-3-oxoalkanoate reductase
MLGAATAQALAARGDEVTVLQRRPSGLGLPEVLTDLVDTDAVRDAVEGHEAVIHLAAKVNLTGPWAAYEHANVFGTHSVVNACRATGVERLVHVSSPSVAHSGASLVGAEAGPPTPDLARGPYARSKAMAELIALGADAGGADHSDVGGRLAVVAIRPHLVWGPGDQQLVARIVERARRGRLALVGSGTVLVDSTYVSNAVDALIAALDHCPAVHGQALVVTNGEPRPIAELIGSICAAAGVPGPRRHVPVKLATAAGLLSEAVWSVRSRGADLEQDPPITRFLAEQLSTAHWFDQRHTRSVLHWTPRVTLDEGLAELAESYRGRS